jgi:hypothetical protein
MVLDALIPENCSNHLLICNHTVMAEYRSAPITSIIIDIGVISAPEAMLFINAGENPETRQVPIVLN